MNIEGNFDNSVGANNSMPKGQLYIAPTENKFRAKFTLPKGQARSARKKKGAGANTQLPKGHSETAPAPSPIPQIHSLDVSAGAGDITPKGQTSIAPAAFPIAQTERFDPSLEASAGADGKVPKGHRTSAPADPLLDLPTLIETIVGLYRNREGLVNSRTRLINVIKARCRDVTRRMICGGPKCDGPELCAKDMAEAAKLYLALHGKGTHPRSSGIAEFGAVMISAYRQLDPEIANCEAALRVLARRLPVIEWVDGVSGVAEISLAKIIGEAGDLSRFPTHSKFWKWMCVGLVDGEAQRKHKDKDKAILNAFKPSRRAVVWNIGAGIMKAQIRKHKDTKERYAIGPYGQLYIDRRAYLEKRDGVKPGQNNHAQRYVEKKFLRSLWEVWNHCGS